MRLDKAVALAGLTRSEARKAIAAGRVSVDGQSVRDAHIGVSKSATYIKALAFEDANQNGGRSTTEYLLRGVEIRLYYEMDGEPVEIASARTDQNGEAVFLRLTPGTYRVGATLPAPYIFGPLGEKISLWYNCFPPNDSSEGMTGPVTAPRGDSLGVGVGAVSTGSLRGSIWWDADMDGKKQSGEGGYAGAEVRIASQAAGVSRTLITGKDGGYRFEGLLAGSYTLTVTLPEDAMFTLPGGDSMLTEGYTFTASRTVTVQDQTEGTVPVIGVMPATSLTVRLYNDVNANGLWDAGEPPFAGATLEVLKGDAVRATVLSDGDGLARVPALRGGDIDVRVTLPDGQVFTVEGKQNDFSAPAATGDMTLRAVQRRKPDRHHGGRRNGAGGLHGTGCRRKRQSGRAGCDRRGRRVQLPQSAARAAHRAIPFTGCLRGFRSVGDRRAA